MIIITKPSIAANELDHIRERLEEVPLLSLPGVESAELPRIASAAA